MSSPVKIAIDAMGGDHGPESAIPGAALALKDFPDAAFQIFGDERRIKTILNGYEDLKNVCRVIHTDKIVRGEDKPSAVIRNGQGTSMRMAVEAVGQGQAQAAVSSGNTGALMATAKVVLRALPGIHRPAIASIFPTIKGTDTVMLDLGANVLVDSENLVQFAVLGAAFARAYKGTMTPSVGLLNVGSEDNKGPDHVRGAHEILSKIEFPGRYYGFVEGTDIALGTVDVIVCDGYAGNIALKTAEGIGKLTGHLFKQALKSDPLALIGGGLSYFALKKFKTKIDPRFYNGGVFMGLGGVCIKSHGGSDAVAFSSALKLAIKLARHGYTERVTQDINHLMSQESFLSQGAYEA